ncbi:hypothetical protein LY90DRAFT_511356 [Neocallimastix californiae]|uniref:MULE transposase domain-containing protein n=1 Tax=Neocallimastix californiae TaxID=1754190 RepID=A0A1Y2BR01_9FUNG|nr:hypothetical protein LY90DRAFT_511356 [Neocallimastix californiae]|eukprot:ORY37164.1 hypothetical protein LY90DRAFT_511356 [Neocallimastix californiae]
MEDNIEIEISETNRGNEQIIINKKHKFNFSFQRKDKSKIYRCTEYKTLNKCKSLIILNDKKEVLKYESLHNHLEKEIDVSISVAKHKIKEEIKKNLIPMNIKPKHIFNVVSQEMGLICPEYSTIRSQMIRNINKQFPPNIKSFDDIPIESEYYKTKRNENFMIFKNTDLIIFQSPFQVYLFSNYHKNIFGDGTFYAAPKFNYQLFITRTYVGEFNMFNTTSISILKNKKQSTYETLFKEIKKNANKFRSNTLITTINFHCDFEQGISNGAKKVFPNINIKYCVWHYKRSLEKQKNILCYHEVKNNNDNLSKKKYNNFLQFLEYFNKNYLLKYNVNNWNYYENIEHLTNNASESYNSYLNNIFPNKPLFYKLIYILKEEEKLSYNDYQRRTKGNWKKKQKIFSATDEIKKILIENYKSKEINLFYNGCNRNELIKLRKECLIDLNDININLK